MNTNPSIPSPASPQSFAAPRPALTVESRQLLGGAREVLIKHGEQTYRLCHTRNDKLILVK